ncbi:hypothetical protein M4J06_004219, partial [Streptomyces coelicoflavus]|uniref:hypothetical protein n=1 Tax=Streptomyces coelicoflavus TaxID=285562 RepID=UPI00210D220C
MGGACRLGVAPPVRVGDAGGDPDGVRETDGEDDVEGLVLGDAGAVPDWDAEECATAPAGRRLPSVSSGDDTRLATRATAALTATTP